MTTAMTVLAPEASGGRELAASATASHARAMIESRFLVAMHRPRSFDEMRVKLLKACTRPSFAATAMFEKPVGGGKSVVGFSIRFAEEAARCMGNIAVDVPVLYDGDDCRVIRIEVTDLESNTGYAQNVSIAKTVERKALKRGQASLGERVNSYGERVFIVEATEDDMLTKQGAITSKQIRNGILRLLPGDLLDEAKETVVAVIKDETARDPDSARKALVDAFYGVGVMPTQLEAYLRHPLGQSSPAEIDKLRRIFRSIRDGEATWTEIVEIEQINNPAPGGAVTAAPAQGGVAGLKARLGGETVAGSASPAPEVDGLRVVAESGAGVVDMPTGRTEILAQTEPTPPIATTRSGGEPAVEQSADDAELDRLAAAESGDLFPGGPNDE